MWAINDRFLDVNGKLDASKDANSIGTAGPHQESEVASIYTADEGAAANIGVA